MEYDEAQWYSIEVSVGIREGLHARPVMNIITEAQKYMKRVIIRNLNSDQDHDAKSAMDLILLEAPRGTPIRIYVEKCEDHEPAASIAQVALSIADIVLDRSRTKS